jgi:hypothetical protein
MRVVAVHIEEASERAGTVFVRCRPGSTGTGCPSPGRMTEESHGRVSQKAQNSDSTHASSNRSALDGGRRVATAADIALLLCVLRGYTDAVFANGLSVPRLPSVLRPSHDGSAGQPAQLHEGSFDYRAGIGANDISSPMAGALMILGRMGGRSGTRAGVGDALASRECSEARPQPKYQILIPRPHSRHPSCNGRSFSTGLI